MSRIFRKTLIAVILVFGVTANATALLSAWLLHHHLSEAYVSKGRAVVVALAATIPRAVARGDAPALSASLAALRHLDGLGYAFVTGRDGKLLADTFDGTLPEPIARTIATRDHGESVDNVTVPGKGDFLQVSVAIPGAEGAIVGVGM